MSHNSMLLNQVATHQSDNIVLSDGGSLQLPSRLLLAEVGRTVRWLQDAGVKGLAIACDNSVAQVVVDLACMEAGVWSLQLPPFFTAEQVAHALCSSGCGHIITDVQPTNSTSTIQLADQTFYLSATQYVGQNSRVQSGAAKVTFTSGSTAEPRGLCLSEAQLMAPVRSITQALAPFALEKHLTVMPQAVLLESVAGIYSALYAGLHCIVPSLKNTSAAHNPGAALVSMIDAHAISSMILVPELAERLVTELCSGASVPACLKYVAVGGSHVRDSLLSTSVDLGLPLYQGYGLSEAGSVVSMNLPDANKPGTVGKVLAHHSVGIATDGEIILSENGFLGYCNEDETASVISGNFHTGDLGHIDNDGYLVVDGRKKNLLITSMGRNVSPEWVESELQGQPGIQQVMVYGDAEESLSALIVSCCPDVHLNQSVSAANLRLPSYARIGRWSRVEAFTPQNGQLTVNGKLRRSCIIEQNQLVTGSDSSDAPGHNKEQA